MWRAGGVRARLPLGVAIGAGAELLRPRAIGVIGGRAFALVLSLVVTPTVYAMMRERRRPRSSE